MPLLRRGQVRRFDGLDRIHGLRLGWGGALCGGCGRLRLLCLSRGLVPTGGCGHELRRLRARKVLHRHWCVWVDRLRLVRLGDLPRLGGLVGLQSLPCGAVQRFLVVIRVPLPMPPGEFQRCWGSRLQ
jgi:hypothetical protein